MADSFKVIDFYKQNWYKKITLYKFYKKEDVVWLPMRQLSTKDQNDTDINNFSREKRFS